MTSKSDTPSEKRTVHPIDGQVTLCKTEDGSLTLHNQELDVSYRSLAGAMTESRYVFLEGTGIQERREEWRVSELGFGGGLSFLLTAHDFLTSNKASSLYYWSVEKDPVAPSFLADPEYTSWCTNESLVLLAQLGLAQARAGRGKEAYVSSMVGNKQIHLTIFSGDWSDAPTQGIEAHAHFHDPFGPSANPEAWSEDCFRWAKERMAEDCILATYSAAGAVRRAMAANDLAWIKIPGPGRKREITLASPSASHLEEHQKRLALKRN